MRDVCGELPGRGDRGGGVIENECVLCGGSGWRRLTKSEIDRQPENMRPYASSGQLTKRCECEDDEFEEEEE